MLRQAKLGNFMFVQVRSVYAWLGQVMSS